MAHKQQAHRLATKGVADDDDDDEEKTSDEEGKEGSGPAVEPTARPQALNQSEMSQTSKSKISSTVPSDADQHGNLGRGEITAKHVVSPTDAKFWRRTRMRVALLGLVIAVVNCYAQATFCIAIVEMVLPADYATETSGSGPPATVSNLTTSQYVQSDDSCPIEFKYRNSYDSWRFETATNDTATGDKKQRQQQLDTSNRFDWDASQQGLLLGAFAVGTAPLQILGGRMAEIYGAKWVLLMGCIGTGLTNLAIPHLAHFSLALLIVDRILMGVAQAGMEPGLMCLLADWLTPQEAGFFISMLLFALCLGFFLGSLCSSFILASGYGWPLTYYVSAGLNLLVALLWYVYADSWPRASRHISREELAFIEAEQVREKPASSGPLRQPGSPKAGCLEMESQEAPVPREDPLRTPWMNILRSRPVWAFIICKISIRWCADVMSNELPTYLANVLHVSIEINGLLNSISSALFAISSFITGWLATSQMFILPRTSFNASLHDPGCCKRPQTNDESVPGQRAGPQGLAECLGCKHDQTRVNARKTNQRKVFQSVASFGSAICLILMTRYDCDIPISMGCLLLLSCFVVMGSGGELQIAYDMTSRYPGTLHGMACTLSVSGWLAPPLYGLILGDQPNSRSRWSIVWYSTAAINALGGLVFVLFADASPRDFDRKRRRASGKDQISQDDLQGEQHDGSYFNAALSGSSCESSPKSSHQPANERFNSKLQSPLEANIGFDCDRLVRCRQHESSFMPTKLDSPLWLKADDLIYPYREQKSDDDKAGGNLQALTARAAAHNRLKPGPTWRRLALSLPFSSGFKFRAAMEKAARTGSAPSSPWAHNEAPICARNSIDKLPNGLCDETSNQPRGSHTNMTSANFRSSDQSRTAASEHCCSSGANNQPTGAANGAPYFIGGPLEEPPARQPTTTARPADSPRPAAETLNQETITHL